MRRNNCGRRPCGPLSGWIAIAVGVLILLGMLLPSGFWWILCAAALICGGIAVLRP